MRIALGLILAAVLSLPAFAGQPVTLYNPQNTFTPVIDTLGLHIVCDSGCSSGGGGNVTIVGPLGVVAPASGVSVTLDSTDGANIAAGVNSNNTALVSNFIQLCGSDGTDCRAISTDTQGVINVNNKAGTAVIGYTSADPCSQATKLTADFESTSSGGNLITGTAAKITYICSLRVTVSTQTNFSLCEATSTACSGGTPAAVYLNTSTTAANGGLLGFDSTHPGGLVDGGGASTIAKTATTGQNVDVLFGTGNSPQVNVHVTYVQQ